MGVVVAKLFLVDLGSSGTLHADRLVPRRGLAAARGGLLRAGAAARGARPAHGLREVGMSNRRKQIVRARRAVRRAGRLRRVRGGRGAARARAVRGRLADRCRRRSRRCSTCRSRPRCIGRGELERARRARRVRQPACRSSDVSPAPVAATEQRVLLMPSPLYSPARPTASRSSASRPRTGRRTSPSRRPRASPRQRSSRSCSTRAARPRRRSRSSSTGARYRNRSCSRSASSRAARSRTGASSAARPSRSSRSAAPRCGTRACP